MVRLYTLGIALFSAIGTFLFGFDTGIATTTIAHQSWIDYMDHPSKGLTGAVVAVYVRTLVLPQDFADTRADCRRGCWGVVADLHR